MTLPITFTKEEINIGIMKVDGNDNAEDTLTEVMINLMFFALLRATEVHKVKTKGVITASKEIHTTITNMRNTRNAKVRRKGKQRIALLLQRQSNRQIKAHLLCHN